ncbi:MAG TPA: hypothetical protein VG797_08225 [Phycisphaerales bacterium]|nr:hypothetical protein [Phycisphaerales bacterium]
MNRTIELLRLLLACNTIEGRKKLQKIVHILREMGYPFPFRYGYHLHGPFSSELKSEIEVLVAERLVEEVQGDTLYDSRMYTYKASREVCDLVGPQVTADWVPVARDLNNKSAQELEAISTLIYLARSGHGEDDIQSRFEKLKPHLSQYFASAWLLAESVLSKQPMQHRSDS